MTKREAINLLSDVSLSLFTISRFFFFLLETSSPSEPEEPCENENKQESLKR